MKTPFSRALAAAGILLIACRYLVAQTPGPDVARKAAHVVPTRQQLAWQQMEFIAFTHFTVNTFTDREWGLGTEDPAVFNPTEFDARQWVKVCKDAGMKMIILTAKHHDGFCLWPSAYTTHSVKSSPWRGGKGDVVGDLAAACKEAGMKLGIYLSPWDRHERTYGTDAYNDYYKHQVTELLTHYGDIAEFWLDGANGEGPNGKKQVYDFDSWFKLMRQLQPNIVIAIMGPDIRWVGNESGLARETEWSVLNRDPAHPLDAMLPDLGSRAMLGDGSHLVWSPAEVDVSIRDGWFYHAEQKPKSLDQLLDIYYRSVGRNSVLLLNLPPDRRGLIPAEDSVRVLELRQTLDATFRTNLAAGARVTARSSAPNHPAAAMVDGDPGTYWTGRDGAATAQFELVLKKPASFNQIMLQEHIADGQRVEQFTIESWQDGKWNPTAAGTTIGYKRLLRFPEVITSRVRLSILQSRDVPEIAEFGLFKSPPRVTVVPRDGILPDSSLVTISSDTRAAAIRYTTDGSEPRLTSQVYAGPFPLAGNAVVTACAFLGDSVKGPVERVPMERVDAATNGMKYSYYEGLWQVLPDFSQLTPVRTGHVFKIGLDGIPVRDDHFALLFEGAIMIAREGDYTFYTNSDDGSRLLVDGDVVVDNDGSHGAKEEKGTRHLAPGRHALVVQYFEDTGDQSLAVSYEGPGIPREPLPAGVLQRTQ